MAIGYRAVLRLHTHLDAVSIAEQQVEDWLRAKKRGRSSRIQNTSWSGPGFYTMGRGAELLVVHADQDLQNRRRVFRLVEVNEHGRWTVSLYAISMVSSHQHPQTLLVEVDLAEVSADGALNRVSPPKVVRSILDLVDARDGSVNITGTPSVVRAGDTSEVFDAVTDENRSVFVVVAVSPAREFDQSWHRVVGSLTKQSVGLTATYVVAHDAADELNSLLPTTHRVGAGQVRTFLPSVDLHDPTDGFRHKWLTLATLTRSLEGHTVAEPLQRRHASVARRRFVETPLPSDVRRAVDVLRRAETSVERAARVRTELSAVESSRRVAESEPDRVAATAAPSIVVDADSTPAFLTRLGSLVKRWLHIDKAAPEHLGLIDDLLQTRTTELQIAEAQLSEAASREEELQSLLDEARRDRDDFELDLAIAQDELIRSQEQATVLRQRIARSAHPEDAHVEPVDESWEAPGTVYEVLERLLPGDDAHPISDVVVFTGSFDGATEIDRRYQTGLYAAHFWRAARVLHDYARAKQEGFEGNVHMYLTDGPDSGVKCPPGQHASTESETTLRNAKWRQERMLPVPETVDDTGVVLMSAHFKPAHHDRFAPRLHYYDDVASSGKVYVGYVGKHLTTKDT